MANPNIVNVTSIYGRTMGASLGTTTTTSLVTCAANTVLKINTIVVSNIDGANDAEVTVYFYDSNVAARYALANTIVVPADSTLVVLGKDTPIFLEESDRIEGGANVVSRLQLVISYEEIS